MHPLSLSRTLIHRRDSERREITSQKYATEREGGRRTIANGGTAWNLSESIGVFTTGDHFGQVERPREQERGGEGSDEGERHSDLAKGQPDIKA